MIDWNFLCIVLWSMNLGVYLKSWIINLHEHQPHLFNLIMVFACIGVLWFFYENTM